jgi:hypothetical protein
LYSLYGIDVFFYLFQIPFFESPPFVYVAKSTLVPGTIPGKPQQKAICLIRWSNRTYFVTEGIATHSFLYV